MKTGVVSHRYFKKGTLKATNRVVGSGLWVFIILWMLWLASHRAL